MPRVFGLELIEQAVHGVLELLVVLADFHAVEHFKHRAEVLLLLRGLVMDVADERHVEQLLGVRPKLVAGLALPGRVRNEAGHELENVLLRAEVRKRIVVHGLLEVDGVQHAYLVPGTLQKTAGLKHQLTFGVGDDVGAVQLHQIGLDEKPRLARAGAADYEDVFVPRGLCVFRTAVHGEPFSLR